MKYTPYKANLDSAVIDDFDPTRVNYQITYSNGVDADVVVRDHTSSPATDIKTAKDQKLSILNAQYTAEKRCADFVANQTIAVGDITDL